MIFGRMENDAAASTTASKAISADQATAAHAAVAANQSLEKTKVSATNGTVVIVSYIRCSACVILP